MHRVRLHLNLKRRPPGKAHKNPRRTQLHRELWACTDQARQRPSQSRRQTAAAAAMIKIKRARIALHIVAVLMAVTAVATAFRCSHGSNRPVPGFVGPSIAPGLIATRSDAAAAATATKKCGLAKTQAAQQKSTSAESPLARRMLLRKARSRPTTTSTSTAAPQRPHREAEEGTPERGGGDVGDLFRSAPPPPWRQQRVCSSAHVLVVVVLFTGGVEINANTNYSSTRYQYDILVPTAKGSPIASYVNLRTAAAVHSLR